jgi:hypothetical protein
MVNILLHHPVVHIYLLLVGVLSIAVIWDRLRHPRPPERTPRPGDGQSAARRSFPEKFPMLRSGRSATTIARRR